MRKEVVWAIVIGVIIGLVILYGIKLANQSVNRQSDNIFSTNNLLTPTPTLKPDLVVTSPEDHSVTQIAETSIDGKTFPNATIAITSDDNDLIKTADQNGNFSIPVKLSQGENIFSIFAVSDQQTASASISIIYTTAKLD